MARFAEPHFFILPRAASHSAPSVGVDAGSDGSRTLAGMLLAAAMAALLVVADQVIDTWSDGHLLAAWVALWTVAFAALALLAPPLRHVAAFASAGMFKQLAEWRARRDEAHLWELACHDPRVVEEIRVAMGRMGT
ncbi:hypothetical protein [Rhodoferax sp. GW822-FHT02A01]|uniref:hypothetical protein n=1 Tax=Rhodoferax sp. GW822-FHT02A01 TaxID=3141537 RepID=UPI00315CCB09